MEEDGEDRTPPPRPNRHRVQRVDPTTPVPAILISCLTTSICVILDLRWSGYKAPGLILKYAAVTDWPTPKSGTLVIRVFGGSFKIKSCWMYVLHDKLYEHFWKGWESPLLYRRDLDFRQAEAVPRLISLLPLKTSSDLCGLYCSTAFVALRLFTDLNHSRPIYI